MNRSEWLKARDVAFRLACRRYWLGCCEYVVPLAKLTDEQRALSQAAVDSLRAYTDDPSAQNRKALVEMRRLLKEARPKSSGSYVRRYNPYHYWKSLSYALRLAMGRCVEMSNWQLSGFAYYFDDGPDYSKEHHEAWAFVSDIKTAFTEYNNSPLMFRDGWLAYKKTQQVTPTKP